MQRNSALQHHVFTRLVREGNLLLADVRAFRSQFAARFMIGELIGKQGVVAEGATQKYLMEGRMIMARMWQTAQSIRAQMGHKGKWPVHQRQQIFGVIKAVEKELRKVMDAYEHHAGYVAWKASLPRGTGADAFGEAFEMVFFMLESFAELIGAVLDKRDHRSR